MTITVEYNTQNHHYSVSNDNETLSIPLSFINSNRLKVSENHQETVKAFNHILMTLFQQKSKHPKLNLTQQADQIYFDLGLLGQKTYKDVEAHFNRMAHKGYDKGCSKVNYQSPALLFKALEKHITAPIQSHLDLGAGTGKMGQYVKEKFPNAHVTGIDLAEDMMAIGTRNKYIDLPIKGDIIDLSLTQKEKYKLITCCGSMDFVQDVEAFSSRVKESLEEGGIIALNHEVFKINHEKDKGHNTIAHLPEMITAQFKAVGIKILEAGQRHDSYTNFITGKNVESDILIGVAL